MKKVRCCFISTFISTWSRQLAVAILAFTVHSYANAEDITLLDPATLAVGTTLGEFLIVKESCPDPTRTDCQPTDKLKYVSATAGRLGQIEFAVSLTDNFDVEVNVDWKESFEQHMIALFKADNKSETSLFVRSTYFWDSLIEFNSSDRRNSWAGLGWQAGSAINNVELSAQSGVAFLNINRTPFKDDDGKDSDTVVLDPSQPYVRLVVGGIREDERLFEVKIKGGTGTGTVPSGADFETGKQTGIQQCQTDPASCGITVTTTGDFESGKQAGILQCQTDPASCSITVTPNVDPNLCKQTVMQQCQLDPSSCGISMTYGVTNGTYATFNPCTRELYIPFVTVPGAFGIMQTYEVYMVQQPSTFTFDLDMNRIKVVQ